MQIMTTLFFSVLQTIALPKMARITHSFREKSAKICRESRITLGKSSPQLCKIFTPALCILHVKRGSSVNTGKTAMF